MQGSYGIFHPTGAVPISLSTPGTSEVQFSDFTFVIDPELLQTKRPFIRIGGRLTGAGAVTFNVRLRGEYHGANTEADDGDLIMSSEQFTAPDLQFQFDSEDRIDLRATGVVRLHITYVKGAALDSMSIADPYLLLYGQDPPPIPLGGPHLYPFHAVDAPEGVPGPFVFDPKSGIAITGTKGPIANRIKAGHQYITLELDDAEDPEPALQFPDEEGWLVFNFGYEDQVWPVRYMGRISDTELALDASFTFPGDLPAGTIVTLASQRSAYLPPNGVGALYATASSAGRVAASEAVDETVAAGVPLNKEVVYPGDRGLGGESLPAKGSYKIADKVRVWGGDDLAAEIKKAQEDE